MNLCKRLSKGTFLDIGAHVGAYSIPVAKLGWKVIAVEPSPDTFRLLEHNRSLNHASDNMIPINTAVWDYDGTAWFDLSASHSGMDSLLPINHIKRVKVETKSLSTLLEELGKVKIVKMDIEGAELRVLEEANNCINVVANWIVEVKHNLPKLWKLFRQKGYTCRIIDSLTRASSTYNIFCTLDSTTQENGVLVN